MELTERDFQLLFDIFEEAPDRLEGFLEGELGWDSETVADFYGLAARFREEAKAAGFWWAQH